MGQVRLVTWGRRGHSHTRPSGRREPIHQLPKAAPTPAAATTLAHDLTVAFSREQADLEMDVRRTWDNRDRPQGKPWGEVGANGQVPWENLPLLPPPPKYQVQLPGSGRLGYTRLITQGNSDRPQDKTRGRWEQMVRSPAAGPRPPPPLHPDYPASRPQQAKWDRGVPGPGAAEAAFRPRGADMELIHNLLRGSLPMPAATTLPAP